MLKNNFQHFILFVYEMLHHNGVLLCNFYWCYFVCYIVLQCRKPGSFFILPLDIYTSALSDPFSCHCCIKHWIHLLFCIIYTCKCYMNIMRKVTRHLHIDLYYLHIDMCFQNALITLSELSVWMVPWFFGNCDPDHWSTWKMEMFYIYRFLHVCRHLSSFIKFIWNYHKC